MSLRFLNDHQHIYRHIDALIVHMQIIISQNIGKRKTLRLTMITTYGVLQNQHSHILQNEITMEQLFG